MATLTSPSRRVLGNKSTNASVHKRDRNETTKAKPDTLDTRLSISSSVTRTSPRAGVKRRFQEVDGDEGRGRSHERDIRPRELNTETSGSDIEVEEMENSDDEEVEISHSSAMDSGSFTSSRENTRLSSTTVLTSFHASQEPPAAIEEQFEMLQEEVSQRTLDKIHATPIPYQSSQLLPLLERPSLPTELSQDSIGMSSFINYHDTDDAEKETADEDTKMASYPPSRIQSPEKARKKLLDDKAETLRTRLQLAMHKIQTNQTTRPFSRLDRPRAPSPDVALPPMRLPSFSDHAVRNSPESQVALCRSRAFNGAYQSQPVRQLNSLPMPLIAPTAYSARYVSVPQLGDREMVHEIPSSPPTSHGSNGGRLERSGGTPSPVGAKRRNLQPKTPRQQLSSPPGSEGDDGDVQGDQRRGGLAGMNANALTSSVVKGEAANGLLELMRAASSGLGRM